MRTTHLKKEDSDKEEQLYTAWQQGEVEMVIASIEVYNVQTNSFSSRADNLFYDRASALEHFAEHSSTNEMPTVDDGYFVYSIRKFAPPLEKRQTYPTIESLFDLSEWYATEPRLCANHPLIIQ